MLFEHGVGHIDEGMGFRPVATIPFSNPLVGHDAILMGGCSLGAMPVTNQ
jgi:hypothetical protein